MFGINAVFQRVFAATGGIESRSRVLAVLQVVIEKSEMRRRDDFYHFVFGIERRKSTVALGGSRRNQLPDADERKGFLCLGFLPTGGKKGSSEDEKEEVFHAVVIWSEGRNLCRC